MERLNDFQKEFISNMVSNLDSFFTYGYNSGCFAMSCIITFLRKYDISVIVGNNYYYFYDKNDDIDLVLDRKAKQLDLISSCLILLLQLEKDNYIYLISRDQIQHDESFNKNNLFDIDDFDKRLIFSTEENTHKEFYRVMYSIMYIDSSLIEFKNNNYVLIEHYRFDEQLKKAKKNLLISNITLIISFISFIVATIPSYYSFIHRNDATTTEIKNAIVHNGIPTIKQIGHVDNKFSDKYWKKNNSH